jgi:hypothetical protein
MSDRCLGVVSIVLLPEDTVLDLDVLCLGFLVRELLDEAG